jgi:TatD DNase family protein
MLPLDLHAHIQPDIDPRELDRLNACVIAVTRTPEDFDGITARRDQTTTWALGAHPGVPAAHDGFDTDRFRELLTHTPVVGEIGLDGRSKVSPAVQRRTLEAILVILAEHPRLASVHSSGATGPVLDAIEAHRPQGVVLHWWRGTEAETRRALDLGCDFSVNAAEVARPKILSLVPRDRVLTETDHPFGDRSQAAPRRPGRVDDIEAAMARRWKIDIDGVRRQVWVNFRRIATQTATADMFPGAFQRAMLAA